MFKKSIALYILLIFSTLSWSQEVLTLEKALSNALENNHRIRVAQNNKEAAVNSAHIGNAGLLPAISGNGGISYSNNDTRQEFAFPGPDGNNTVNEIEGAQSLSYNASIGLSYTVFDGLANIYSFELLKEQAEGTGAQSRLNIENTLLQVTSAFYEVARLQANLNVVNEAVSISADRFNRVQAGYDFGRNNRVDLLSAQVDLQTDSIDLTEAETLLRNAKRNLNVLMGVNVENDYSVREEVEFRKDLEVLSLKNDALKNNSSLLSAYYNNNIAKYNAKIAGATRMPRLAVNASYGYNETNSESGILLQNQTIGFTGGATLSIPIFDGFRRNIARQNAKIQLESSEELLAQTELEVERDVMNTFTEYQNLLNQLKIQKRNVETAELNLERTNEAFKLGQVNNTQFREAQLNLISAKNRLNNTQFGARQVEIRLLQLAGRILEENQ